MTYTPKHYCRFESRALKYTKRSLYMQSYTHTHTHTHTKCVTIYLSCEDGTWQRDDLGLNTTLCIDARWWNANGKLAPTGCTRLLSMIARRTARTALSSEICAGCRRLFKLLSCVTSNFRSGPNSKSTKGILTLFKMPKTADHYLFIYQKLSLLPSLSNEAK